MNFFSNLYCKRRLLPIVLCGLLIIGNKQAVGQQKTDSLFEKVTIALPKDTTAKQRMKDGARQLYLFCMYSIDTGLKNFYYSYRDSILGVAQGDTILKPEARKKLFDAIARAKYTSPQLPFSFVLDQMVNDLDSSASNKYLAEYNAVKKENEELKTSNALTIVIFSVILFSLLAFYFWKNPLWKKKKAEVDNSMTNMEEGNEEVKQNKKEEKKSEKINKLKEDIKNLEKECDEAYKLIEALEKKSNNLEDGLRKEKQDKEIFQNKHDKLVDEKAVVVDSLNTANAEKTALEQKIGELEVSCKNLLETKQAADGKSDQVKKNTDKLESFLASITKSSVPENHHFVYSWYLLKDLIKAIRNDQFTVLSTPNFCKWILNEENTYPELNTSNISGNAEIVNTCRELKQRGIERISPDNSYLILNNQKITQQVYEAL